MLAQQTVLTQPRSRTRSLPTPTVPPLPATCAECPFFEDYREERGRGWCHAFDNAARRHHRRADECRYVIEAAGRPLTVRVRLVSKELDPDYLEPVHEFVADIEVLAPTRTEVEITVAAMGFTVDYDIADYWIPAGADEF